MADERVVVFDARADLWAAVAEGIVQSSDLSPSGKFRPALRPQAPLADHRLLPFQRQKTPVVPPPLRTVSPIRRRSSDAATQTDACDDVAVLKRRLKLTLASLRAVVADKENLAQ